VLRYFNVYGPREPLKGEYAPVVGLFKRQKTAGSPLTIVGDGTQRRDFTYIDDVVAANVLAGSLDLSYNYKAWNVGSGKNYSINEIANMIGGEKIHVPPRPAEVHVTLADINDTIKELGWNPIHKLEDMINCY
jgi:UDP-glucose 4-epimerase